MAHSISRQEGLGVRLPEFLKCGDDDGDAGFERFGKLSRILVDLLHNTLTVVELLDSVLKLPVENDSIGDDNHAIE